MPQSHRADAAQCRHSGSGNQPDLALRLLIHRLAYFKDAWNGFDFLVVAISLVPASGPLAVLRALRVLRVLRLITLVPSMKRVVGGLLAALPGLGSVSMSVNPRASSGRQDLGQP